MNGRHSCGDRSCEFQPKPHESGQRFECIGIAEVARHPFLDGRPRTRPSAIARGGRSDLRIGPMHALFLLLATHEKSAAEVRLRRSPDWPASLWDETGTETTCWPRLSSRHSALQESAAGLRSCGALGWPAGLPAAKSQRISRAMARR
jgi:hypothetical protein